MAAAPTDPRSDFRLAAEGFVAVVQSIGRERWDDPALGVWTVRDLTGHTGRALLTVEQYLDAEPPDAEPSDAAPPDAQPPDAAPRDAVPQLDSPAAYYRRAAADLADPQAVAERGRRAGAALGEQPAAAVASAARRVLAVVDDAPDHAVARTPVGTVRLLDYLPTRTFELVVHSLDLCTATGVAVPAVLARPVGACLRLAVDLADVAGRGPDVLLALTGRRRLPEGFTVL